MKIATFLIAFVQIATAAGLVFYVPEHFVQTDIPLHARYHLYMALFWIVGFCIVNLIILFIPFQQKQKWAWWAIAIGLIFVQGGFFLADYVMGGSTPRLGDDIQMVVMILMMLIALGITKKYFFKLDNK